ncbi:hypothetical protein HanPSC8_Chr09g0371431 [Helianthus annuus]|nr:hypothetical protein HanPSC8_Chr09g0371431 [Helianthus annuus]
MRCRLCGKMIKQLTTYSHRVMSLQLYGIGLVLGARSNILMPFLLKIHKP